MCVGLQVQQGSVVAAGAVVTPGKTVPSGEVWAGSPAKLLRKLEEEETGFIAQVQQRHDRVACSLHAHTCTLAPRPVPAGAAADPAEGCSTASLQGLKTPSVTKGLAHNQPCGSGSNRCTPLRRRRMITPRLRRCMRRRTPRLLTRSRYWHAYTALGQMHHSCKETG